MSTEISRKEKMDLMVQMEIEAFKLKRRTIIGTDQSLVALYTQIKRKIRVLRRSLAIDFSKTNVSKKVSRNGKKNF